MPGKAAPSLVLPSFQSSKERSLFSRVMRNLGRGGESDAACPCAGSRTASSTMSEATSSGSLRWRTIVAGQNTGRVGSSLRPNKPIQRTVQQRRYAPLLPGCWRGCKSASIWGWARLTGTTPSWTRKRIRVGLELRSPCTSPIFLTSLMRRALSVPDRGPRVALPSFSAQW